METQDKKIAAWRKSSRSGGPNGGCVAISRNPAIVFVADSKNLRAGQIALSPEAFDQLLSQITNKL